MGAGASATHPLCIAVNKILTHPQIAGLDQTLTSLDSAADLDAVRSLSIAFVKAVGGCETSREYLANGVGCEKYAAVAKFFVDALDYVKTEVEQAPADSIAALSSAADGDASGSIEGAEGFWKAFFPNGVGMMSDTAQKVADLRAKRKVTIESENPNPITDPITEILFTSNVLLGLPAESTPISSLPYTTDFKDKLEATKNEQQVAWFDHPIQIGVDQAGNEILYGLKGLNAAVAWEKEKGNIPQDAQMLTALSITCTHKGLQGIAKQYVEEEFASMPAEDKLVHLKIMLFSELQTDAIVDQLMKPCCEKIGVADVEHIREIFGVEGQYGRHYSFLKAVLAVINAFVDSKVRATFKIDIDQLFIQDSLISESNQSALDHFKTPLWGAKGKNWKGDDIELGMIAGALCNQSDFDKTGGKLYVADVLPPKPDKKLAADELVFFSGLPQAISTEAEMMTREDGGPIQRIHVTGGTNGILLDTLVRFRPFCPSFIGRAEDQSYIFSTFCKPGAKLGYYHKSGLIMRHDKEAFAAEAIEAARIGKMVGDYERMLLFSEYGRFCSSDFDAVKDLVNPFTGCFCIPMPKTVMFLRFALKALGFIANGATKDAVDFTIEGSPRVSACLLFTNSAPGSKSQMETQWLKEQKSWDDFYNGIEACKGDEALSTVAAGIFAEATAKI